jgi:type VI secretion system protein ImpA
MSARWEGEEALLQPITPEQPCGENLEDTELLTSFDAYRLFGQPRPLDAPQDPNDKNEKRVPKPPESPEWVEIRDKANDALRKSKDLRLLATLGTALLRTDGVPGFAATLNVASQWLETHWEKTYPLVDEDAILRRNALNCFADPMAVVDRLRRVPLVRSRQHGTFALRDIDIATGLLAPGEGDRPVDEQQVSAAFGSMPIAALTDLHESVATGVASLKKIDATMREAAGSDATPAFEQLSTQLSRMGQMLRAQLASHPERSSDAAAADPSANGGGEGAALGAVRSRQDAIRALDAVSAFFRQTEPSSPVPLFLERAKRLVSKDFLEVLADIAPDALAQARAAGGLKDSEPS